MAEQITKEEAIQFLTMQQDLANDTETKQQFIDILLDTGVRIGYAPAFRCLVRGQTPKESIRWGK